LSRIWIIRLPRPNVLRVHPLPFVKRFLYLDFPKPLWGFMLQRSICNESALWSEVRGVRIDVWPPFQRFCLDFEAVRGKGRRESRRGTWIWVNRMIAVVLYALCWADGSAKRHKTIGIPPFLYGYSSYDARTNLGNVREKRAVCPEIEHSGVQFLESPDCCCSSSNALLELLSAIILSIKAQLERNGLQMDRWHDPCFTLMFVSSLLGDDILWNEANCREWILCGGFA